MPRKRKKRADEPPPIHACVIPGCETPAMGAEGHCFVHGLHVMLGESGRRAAERGDVMDALVAGLGGVALNHVDRYMQQMPFQGPFGSPPPTPPCAPDPFAVLGLDQKTATEKHVRDVQRRLASIYHPDTAANSIAASKIQEINAAAEACLERIRER